MFRSAALRKCRLDGRLRPPKYARNNAQVAMETWFKVCEFLREIRLVGRYEIGDR